VIEILIRMASKLGTKKVLLNSTGLLAHKTRLLFSKLD
tara:strand:+ start:5502 stop:5615 length:114 start_codon:yes stop_codon:yes gene_type:complete